MSTHPYTEKAYQESIIGHLVKAGYRELAAVYDPGDDVGDGVVYFDQHRALLPSEFVAFVAESQPEAWGEIRANFRESAGDRLVEALADALDQKGAVWVWRRGFVVAEQQIRLAGFEPTDAGTESELRRYRANRFRVVQELKYNPLHVVDDLGDHHRRLDLTLFLNGIPLITAELKNQLTNQTVGDAIEQYQNTREPSAPIFRFPYRTLVHFVVDKRRAFMTTRLAGVHTRWFPFDRGWQDGLGNPPPDAGGGRSGVEHLWEDAWQPASLLEMVQRYVAMLPPDDPKPEWGPRQHLENSALVFPRYHQRRAVRRIRRETVQAGVGRHFLIQHSTGSGKSLTLGWLSQRLADLHDERGKKIFDKVVVISDRQVIVSQLQSLIPQLSIVDASDMVTCITGKSEALADALNGKVPVVICTLHRFSYVSKELVRAKGKRYAVVVDEAHSSQHGTLSEELVKTLQDMEEAGPKNITFYAFTGTPKDATLQHFGDKVGEGWKPFDLYSMKQAREEGFIVDTLQHYISWRQEMDATTVAPGDIQVKGNTADVYEIMSNDPAAIERKAGEIARHYLGVVHGQLGGQARAMVVANGREAARCYLEKLRAALDAKGRQDVKLLVAFSGLLEDDEEKNTKTTEEKLNGGIGGEQIPARFRKDHHILIVANKYQTGFDEPRLVAMYIDKGIRSIAAVQTLSRLNRPFPGKGEKGLAPIVVDFYNDPEQVFAAFREYDTTYDVKYFIPEDLLASIADELDAWGVYNKDEAERALALVEHPAETSTELDALLNACMSRFEHLPTDEERWGFRHRMLKFLALFCSAFHLSPDENDKRKRLRSRRALYSILKADIESWRPGGGTPAVSITREHVALEVYDLVCHGRLPPPDLGSTGPADLPEAIVVGDPKEMQVRTLQEVVDAFNTLYGLPADEKVISLAQARILDATNSRESLIKAARTGNLTEFRRLYRHELAETLVGLLDDETIGEFAGKLLDEMDGSARAAIDRVAQVSFDMHQAA